ncbi:MAG: polymerase subunit gamma/tau [Abditibacteriota bacterium]|nr:polymerase subunit gamma/tau [Abditibacteriota bacterium]
MSLYRKYRPQTFEDVVGQEHIAQTLRNALSSEPLRVAHAYLFCGPRGTGKTTSARLLAKCLNCETGPTPTPCNQCDFCLSVTQNRQLMDLMEIDAASNTGVDNVREAIIDKVNIAPALGRYRIYIIDEVHMLSQSSFNALLKTLEEPPPHAVFVLATTDAHKVPPTISSRCQRFDFRRVGPADIVGRLQYVAQSEGMELQDGAARLMAHTADGALRDALTLLEQVAAFSPQSISEADVRLVLGTVSQELLLQIIEAVAANDAHAALAQIERATEEGVSFTQLTRDLTNYCRDLLLLTVGYESSGVLTDAEKKSRHRHSQMMGRTRLLACVEALRAAEKEMRQSTDHRLLLELTLVRAASGAEIEADAAAHHAAALHAVPQHNAPAARAPLAPPAEVPRAAPARPVPAWRQPEDPTPTAAPTVATSPVLAAASAPRTAPQSTLAAAPAGEAPHHIEAMDAGDGISARQSTLNAEHAAPAEEAARATLVEAASVDAAPVDGVLNGAAFVHEEAIHAVPVADEPVYAVPVQDAPVEATPEASPAEEVPAAPVGRRKGRRIHNLDEFIELWPFVLLRVKKKLGVTAVAWLHDASPVDFDDKNAVIEFGKEFHYEKACDAAKRLPFEQVVNECLATPHILKFRLAQPKPKAAPVVVEDAGNDDDDDDDTDIVTMAQSLFAAEVVARSGGG